MEIVFLWPFAVLAFLLPIFVRLYFKPVDSAQSQLALCVPFFNAIQSKNTSFFSFFPNIISVLCWGACLAFTIALMRPVSFGSPIYIPSKARQMMLVLDVSVSMNRQDFIWNNRRSTRLNAVQKIAQDFILSRKGDAVGLTIFGTQPYLYTPLTLDTQTASLMLSEIGAGMAGSETAMGDALALALKQMKEIKSDEKVIILLSDGNANAGIIHPEEIIEPAKNNQIKIYTVGLGSDDVFGSTSIDEALLQKIALQTNGRYFRVKTTADLQKMYDEINKIEPIEVDGAVIRPQTELFWIPLCVSMILFLIALLLKERIE